MSISNAQINELSSVRVMLSAQDERINVPLDRHNELRITDSTRNMTTKKHSLFKRPLGLCPADNFRRAMASKRIKENSKRLTRSSTMARVKSTNTTCELTVRKMLFSMGYRYRLYVKDLPGKPDIVFKSKRKVIFVNGCFWHQHPNCKRSSIPKTNREYWSNKLTNNAIRDYENYKKLISLKWEYLVVWECETKDLNQLSNKLLRYLESG